MPQVVIFTDVTYPGFGRYAGTYRIATELRLAGYEVQVVDFFTYWTFEQLCLIIDKFIDHRTVMVGFSCTFMNTHKEFSTRIERQKKWSESSYGVVFGREDILDVIGYIKAKNPHTSIVVGGHKADLCEVEPLNKYVDWILNRQSDVSVVRLVEHLVDQSVELKTSYGNVINDSTYPVEDYNKSRIIYNESDLIFPKENLPMEIARGCVFKCTFCSYPLLKKKQWDFTRDPKLICTDLLDAYNKYGTEGFLFADDTYNDSVEKVEKLHEEFVKLPFDLNFSTYARADMMISKPHTMDLLYESGMRSVFFGIETFNREAGKSIGKGMDPQKLRDGLYEAKSRPGWDKIMTTSGFIIGLPHETEESLQETFEWLQRDDCPLDSYSPTVLQIAPTSTIGKNMMKHGYEFDSNGKWKSEWMTEEQAEDIVNQWYKGMTKKPRSRFTFTHFNRMKNIGWTLDDFDQLRYSNKESWIRKNELKEQYYYRLINI